MKDKNKTIVISRSTWRFIQIFCTIDFLYINYLILTGQYFVGNTSSVGEYIGRIIGILLITWGTIASNYYFYKNKK